MASLHSWPSQELVASNVDQQFLAFHRPVGRPFFAFTSGHISPGNTGIPHSHPCIALHGCLSGPVELTTSRFRQTLQAGQFYLFPSHEVHCWRSIADRTAATIGLLIDVERPGDWPASAGVAECCQQLGRLLRGPEFFSPVDDLELQTAFWRASDILVEEKPCSKIAIHGTLWLLLSLLVQRLDKPEADYVSTDAARRIRRILLKHVYDKPTLPQIARESRLSVPNAKRVFSETYGCGIMDYLIQMKIYQAQRMLGDLRLSIQEISLRLGFSSSAYFSRLFRARTSESPGQFRRRLRQIPHRNEFFAKFPDPDRVTMP